MIAKAIWGMSSPAPKSPRAAALASSTPTQATTRYPNATAVDQAITAASPSSPGKAASQIPSSPGSSGPTQATGHSAVASRKATAATPAPCRIARVSGRKLAAAGSSPVPNTTTTAAAVHHVCMRGASVLIARTAGADNRDIRR